MNVSKPTPTTPRMPPPTQLHQYLMELVQSDPESPQYQRTINQLCGWIPKQKYVRKDYNIGIDKRYCPNFKYEDALQDALVSFVKSFDNFLTNFDLNEKTLKTQDKGDLYKRFTRYFNTILIRRAIDQYRKLRPKLTDEATGEEMRVMILSLDARKSAENDSSTSFLEDVPSPELGMLDNLIENERGDELRQQIEEISEQLETCCVKKNPDCNCFEILLRRCQEPPQTWEEIAQDLNVPFGTVSPHWYRKCKPLLRQLKK